MQQATSRKLGQPSESAGWLRRILRNVLPFLALFGCTAGMAGIYYVVEKDCAMDGNRANLTFWSAFHFIASIETTIGYGDIYPCTLVGRILAIVFALIGLPLTLLCLERLGKWMELWLVRFWHSVKRLRRRARSNVVTVSPTFTDYGDPSDVPISVALFIAIFWILASTAYFYFALDPYYSSNSMDDKLIGDWNFFTAFYFTMISYLTIGLGDIAPRNYDYVCVNFLFMFVGLAMVTMCITLVQSKLEHLFDRMQQMLRREYAAKLSRNIAGELIGHEGENYRGEVSAMMAKTAPGWLRALLKEHDMAKLVDQYMKDCLMMNRETQTDIKQSCDMSVNTEDTEDDDRQKKKSTRKFSEDSLDSTVIEALCAHCGKTIEGDEVHTCKRDENAMEFGRGRRQRAMPYSPPPHIF